MSDESVSGNNQVAVHFAQTDINEVGSYEYKFRVLNYNQGNFEANFEGNFTIKIFKVIYLDTNLAVL